jgi:transposase InsO family protein
MNSLLDTGSTVSLIRLDAIPKGLSICKETIYISGINDNKQSSQGSVTVMLDYGFGTIKVKLWVVKSLPEPILLGMDILSKIVSSIDIGTRTITWNSQSDDKTQEAQTSYALFNQPRNKNDIITQLQVEFSNVFAKDSRDVGRANGVEHQINIRGNPVKHMYKSIPQALEGEFDRQVQEMLYLDIIRPSNSPFASPALFQAKKDGTWRLCVDYRKLNEQTIKDAYPMPRPKETFRKMAGAKFFSTLDLQSGYWQIRMRAEDREKTAFVTPRGLFEFTVMPFGLTNAPATFQRAMDALFPFEQRDHILVYMDDLLIFSRTLAEHEKHLRDVLTKLQNAGLKIKPSKCKFFQDSVEYVGHTISPEGIKVDESKLEAIKEYKTPGSIQDVRKFIGFANYYHDHIPNFAQIAEPLHALTRKKAKFRWTPECEGAFQTLKNALIQPPILGFPDFTQEFHLRTDASDFAIGAVLEQIQENKRVAISFKSRTLSQCERNYSTTEKEALAIVWAVGVFRNYIYGHKFNIWTDHNPLAQLKTLRDTHGRIARWFISLQEYEYEIKYEPGVKNVVADALSRPNEEISAVLLAQLEDPVPGDIITAIRAETALEFPANEEQVRIRRITLQRIGGLLYRHLKLQDKVIPQIYVPTSVRQVVIDYFHEKNGHYGRDKTYDLLRDRFYWPGYLEDVRSAIRACDQCQRAGHRDPPIPLCPMSASAIGELIEWDLTGPIKYGYEGDWYILVITDTFSKWVEAIPMQDTSSAALVTAFTENWLHKYGPPKQLHSDQGANFLGAPVQEMCRRYNIRQSHTTAYNPQGNGAVERINRTLKDRIKRVCNDGMDWKSKLSEILWAYRTAVHKSTGKSPFEIQFGRRPILAIDRAIAEVEHNENVTRPTENPVDLIHAQVAENLRQTAQAMKQSRRKRTKSKNLEVGQEVLVEKGVKNWKYGKNWEGPFEISRVPTNETVEIRRYDGSLETIHRDRVKLYITRYAPPPYSNENSEGTLPAGSASSESDSTIAATTSVDSRPNRRRRKPRWMREYDGDTSGEENL